ncbi:hypothetical protein DERP_015176 [Dermatophagoides pteronyssinus]|uniref:Uncharacterized protein n=1 Tax=Dermatophagoides pteronyssinus TaxID=6956 RepID=A0ABQ8J1I4_DERPT|nr:hypothetical protein DERP_015176 [Dermatophagoides pteronyssinus]
MDNNEIDVLFNKIDNLKRHPLLRQLKIKDQLDIPQACLFDKISKDIGKKGQQQQQQHSPSSMKQNSSLKVTDTQTVIRLNEASKVLANNQTTTGGGGSVNNQTTEMNSELRIIIIDENWSQFEKADNKSVLFWYHGRCVEDDDTPRTLNIKDNEVILAHYIK